MIVATVFLITIILGIINHLYNFVTRAGKENQRRINRVDKVVKNEIKIKNYNINDKNYQHPLRDYYILSSMNSCMNGESLDGAEMNISALRDSIRLGCRFLDFEIYQKNGQPVIAVGEYQNRQRWTSTNTLNFEYVMTEVNKMALGGSISSPNYADPIILSFRIKTLQNNIYNIMAETLKKTFGKKLLNNKEITKKYNNLSNVPLHKLKNKVIIYCNNMNGNDKNFKDTNFENLVNISEHSNLSSTYNPIVSYSEVTGVRDTGNLEWANILNSCKQNICLVFSHNEDKTTVDINKKPFRENGVQISPINITSIKDDVNESPAKEHWDFFNKTRSAFVLKDEKLRYKPKILPEHKIPKQDPKVSFKTRKVKTSLGHNFDM
tara:strand:- start:1170 stop:2306 length:1137 start_codon:yes stop_codon:yes gene_type:complete